MDYIVEKILQDAQKEAEGLLMSARANSRSRVESAKIQIESDREADIERAMSRAVAEAKQAELNAKVRARRDELTARTGAIDAVFADAKVQLGKSGASLANSLKSKFAKPTDKVEVLKDGGIIVENPNYRLSLTLDELLAGLRADIELGVAKILFGK